MDAGSSGVREGNMGFCNILCWNTQTLGYLITTNYSQLSLTNVDIR